MVAAGRSAELIGIDASAYRIDGIYDAGAHTPVKAARIKREEGCPACGRRAHVHGSARSTACRAPYAGKPPPITLKKRRCRCSSRGKAFAEGQPLLSRLTPHAGCGLEAFVQDGLSWGRAIAEPERMTGASESIIAKMEAGAQMPERYLPRDLCIDEARTPPEEVALRRGGLHMACCIYDAGEKTLIGDDPKTAREHPGSLMKGEGDAVGSVSCNLFGSCMRIAEDLLPNAVICADELHASKLVTGAVDDVRKRLSRAMADDERYEEKRKALRKAHWRARDALCD